jgi:hypothetical protein
MRRWLLPDAIPAKAGSLNWAVICYWPEKEGMAHFLPSWYKFYRALRVSRLPRASAASDGGTSLIGAGKLSRYRILVWGTSAVSRYNLSRSQKTVKVC